MRIKHIRNHAYYRPPNLIIKILIASPPHHAIYSPLVPSVLTSKIQQHTMIQMVIPQNFIIYPAAHNNQINFAIPTILVNQYIYMYHQMGSRHGNLPIIEKGGLAELKMIQNFLDILPFFPTLSSSLKPTVISNSSRLSLMQHSQRTLLRVIHSHFFYPREKTMLT